LIAQDVSRSCVVLLFDGRRAPSPLTGISARNVDDQHDIDEASGVFGRLIVVGTEADLASVLTRLLRTERLDVEVGHATGWRTARRARDGAARRVPLIRDDTGHVIVGGAEWHGQQGEPLHGEAVVDDTVLFDGEVTGIRIQPTLAMPGLRACVIRPGRSRWVGGRAAQLGTPGAIVVRDGTEAPKIVRRSTFYRHTQGWLLVR
jgi:hypothetical protein